MGVSEVAMFGVAVIFILVFLPIVAAVYAMLLRAACGTYNYVWSLEAPTPVWQNYEAEPEIPAIPAELPPTRQSDNPFATPVAAPALRKPLAASSGVPVPGFWKAVGIVVVMLLISMAITLFRNVMPQNIPIFVATAVLQFLFTAGVVAAMLPTNYVRAMAITFFWLAFLFVIVLGIFAVIATFFAFMP